MTNIAGAAVRGVLATALVSATFGLAPAAHADCSPFAQTPHLETKADGRVVVQGYGGAFCFGGNATVSVCLDYNVVTRVDTCRSYTSPPEGSTTETNCLVGVWMTQVVVVPNSGAPSTSHTIPGLIVTPTNCPVRANAR
jgi:hypothetical protein